MTGPADDATTHAPSDEWNRAGAALLGAMNDVIAEVDEEDRPLVLETAAYWLALGVAAAIDRPTDSQRLLDIIEPGGADRDELLSDARAFLDEAVG